MRKNKSIAGLLLLLLSVSWLSCSDSEEDQVKIPSNVLSRERYTKLLVDFSLAESAANLNIKNLSGSKFDSAYAFNPLKENKVSQALYDSTISFYSKHPEIYKEIYEDVLSALSKMLAEKANAGKDSVSENEKMKK
jgi:hypothetical protein